jgi:hypothetical protein
MWFLVLMLFPAWNNRPAPRANEREDEWQWVLSLPYRKIVGVGGLV